MKSPLVNLTPVTKPYPALGGSWRWGHTLAVATSSQVGLYMLKVQVWSFYFYYNKDYLSLIDHFFNLGAHFVLTFELRPQRPAGLLFHFQRDDKSSLDVYLMKNKVNSFIDTVVFKILACLKK